MESSHKVLTMLISEDEYNFLIEMTKRTKLTISELVLLSVLAIDLPKHQRVKAPDQ